MGKRIICNASPLILLSKIGRIYLLNDLFDEVLVPESVWVEVTRKPDDMTEVLMSMQSDGAFTLFAVENRAAVSAMIGRLHIGEVEVIVGAGEVDVPNVILDDGYARSKAKQMGLSVTGTLGVLIAAYEKGFVTDLKAEIDNLRSIGFRISEAVIKQII